MSGMRTHVMLWPHQEAYLRRRTKEDQVPSPEGCQGRVCIEQMWIPSMSPDMTDLLGRKQASAMVIHKYQDSKWWIKKVLWVTMSNGTEMLRTNNSLADLAARSFSVFSQKGSVQLWTRFEACLVYSKEEELKQLKLSYLQRERSKESRKCDFSNRSFPKTFQHFLLYSYLYSTLYFPFLPDKDLLLKLRLSDFMMVFLFLNNSEPMNLTLLWLYKLFRLFMSYHLIILSTLPVWRTPLWRWTVGYWLP